MAFTLPDFNLTVNVFTGPWVGKVLRLTTPGNLAFGRRVEVSFIDGPVFQGHKCSLMPLLLTPAGTDLRAAIHNPQNDILEIPAGSSRWYELVAVEDIGKGFSNEHRAGFIAQIDERVSSIDYPGAVWPVPMP